MHDEYPPFGTNPYGALDFAASDPPLSFSYTDNPSLFIEAPQDAFHHDMSRSESSNGGLTSHAHHLSELPPSLLSSASGPSIPSAPSSTVGSPYSGHSNLVSTTDSWNNSYHGLGFDPTIVSHEGYTHDCGGAGDHDLNFPTHDKLTGNFVGECANFSYSHIRSSTLPTAVTQRSLSLPPHAPVSASPEPLTIDAILDRTNARSAGPPPPQAMRRSPSPPTPAGPPRDLHRPSAPIFKSPSTPASALNRSYATTTSASAATPVPVPTACPNNAYSQLQPPMPHHGNHFQTHFFAQSSGSFMPPLESSCSFSPDAISSVFHSSSPSVYPAHWPVDKHCGSSITDLTPDPSLIQAPRTSYADVSGAYAEQNLFQNMCPPYNGMSPSASPALSPPCFQHYPTAHFSPPMSYSTLPLPSGPADRRGSIASLHSGQSQASPMSSADYDDDFKDKGRCPNPECGRVFKDLKAHMLTHQSERPEKCPIANCEYNQKGFARKYDKNRHTLTHYKGTMICGFCPGSGSAAEKSFNRADVFKRHLTSVHGVEQTAPNSRKRSPIGSAKKLSSYCQDATGKCSTCSATFTNAQDFYEHLDDCVLRVVQQEEPSEAINQQHLANIATDDAVKETMERHLLRADDSMIIEEDVDDDEDDDEDDEPSVSSRPAKSLTKAKGTSSRAVLSGGVTKLGRPPKKGLTYSKGGVPVVSRGRKSRKHYPPSWGMSADKMQMKKRVLCVYDGERQLWKDDLMMHNEFEVRMKLADGKSYVTDLDMETLKRAEAFHHATEEEKGPWIQEPFDLEELMS